MVQCKVVQSLSLSLLPSHRSVISIVGEVLGLAEELRGLCTTTTPVSN